MSFILIKQISTSKGSIPAMCKTLNSPAIRTICTEIWYPCTKAWYKKFG